MEIGQQGEIKLARSGADRSTVVQDGPSSLDGGHLRRELGILAGLLLKLGKAGIDGLQISQDELGVDGLDIGHWIH